MLAKCVKNSLAVDRLTPWTRVLPEKLTGPFSYSRNSPHFMEPEVSLPHSQQPATCPYPEPDRSSPCPIPFFTIHFNIILPSTPGSFKWFLPLGFPIKTLYAPLLSPPSYVLHALPIQVLLITRELFCEEYRA